MKGRLKAAPFACRTMPQLAAPDRDLKRPEAIRRLIEKALEAERQ